MRKNLSILAAVAGAAAFATSAQAGFGLSASVEDGTVDGNFQTATISLTGDALASLSAIAGTAGNAMTVSTGDGSNLFNHDSWSIPPFFFFDGSSAYASPDGTGADGTGQSKWDSGFLEWMGLTDAGSSPGFAGEMTAFAFGGAPDSSVNAAVFDGDPGTPAVIGAGVQVLRLTWDRNTTVNFGALFQINTPLSGTSEVFLTIDLPAVPAPGAMALLGLAGICGVSRRRRKA